MRRIFLARMWFARHITRLLLGQVHVGIIHDALYMYAGRERNRLWVYEAHGLLLHAFPENDYTEF